MQIVCEVFVMPRKKDPEIYTYEKKNGETWYGFKTYLGIDKETGKSKKVTRQGFKTRKEAEKAKTKLKADGATAVAHNQAKRSNKKTVQEIYDIWLPIYSANVKDSTYLHVENAWKNHIQPEFGNDFIDSIDIDHLQRYSNHLAETHIEFDYILNLLRKLIKYAIMRGFCTQDPFNKIIVPKKSGKKSTRPKKNYYDLKELEQFLESAKNYNYRYYTLFMILGSLGLRRGEALALKWGDIDEDKNTISILRTVSKNKKGKKALTSTKTTSSERTLFIPKNLKQVLCKYKEQSFNTKDDDFLFVNLKGEYYTGAVANIWQQEIYDNDSSLRKITAHGFRHTLATILYEGSVTIQPKDVQTLLGHKKVTTALNIYTHTTEERKKNIADSINNLDI